MVVLRHTNTFLSEEKPIVHNHCYHITSKFTVGVKENQEQLPSLYWLPNLNKRPYKARFIANSSSCTTIELSKLLTSCLTAVKNHLIKYCETIYERDGINLFWSIKNSNEALNKFKSKGFKALELSTYDFSTLYTTLPHHLIRLLLLLFVRVLRRFQQLFSHITLLDKLIDLIERTFSGEKALY